MRILRLTAQDDKPRLTAQDDKPRLTAPDDSGRRYADIATCSGRSDTVRARPSITPAT